MSVKKYILCGDDMSHMIEDDEGEYVLYMDYVALNTKLVKIQAERDHLSEYTDHLVSFSKLPCLPKDLENLREANTKLAEENSFLQFQITQLQLASPSIKELRLSRDMWMDRYNDLQRKVNRLTEIINN